MEDQRELNALARIERAIDRIEAATTGAGGHAAGTANTEALRTAHDQLRGSVQRAIAEIDDLLAQGAGAEG